MSVKAIELQNPERGMKVQNREESTPDELTVLLHRIVSAKGMTPMDTAPHCTDCFRRGWKAAIREIEGGG